MKEYKRKRKAEEWTYDVKPNKVGVKVEGAERVRAKKIIRKELQEMEKEKEVKDDI